MRVDNGSAAVAVTQDYLAESGVAFGCAATGAHARRPALPTMRVPILSLVVWILKREVRAIGGCLGMYRR